jgi:hypothetical protein
VRKHPIDNRFLIGFFSGLKGLDLAFSTPAAVLISFKRPGQLLGTVVGQTSCCYTA